MSKVADKLSQQKTIICKVRCKFSNENGITKGNIYDCVSKSDWGFDINSDDYGNLSGWEKSYFEIVE